MTPTLDAPDRPTRRLPATVSAKPWQAGESWFLVLIVRRQETQRCVFRS